MALKNPSTRKYTAEMPMSRFTRFDTDLSTASTAFPEFDDLSELGDSDDDFEDDINAMMKAVKQSIAFFNDAEKTNIQSDEDFEAEIEAKILEATTRKTTTDFPIEEQISFEASICMWDQLAATGNAGSCESGRCRCSISCFAPLPEGRSPSTETDDGEAECDIGFWTKELLSFAMGLCAFAFFASIDIQSKLTKLLIRFCVSLLVLCVSSPWTQAGYTPYVVSAAISILTCVVIGFCPQTLHT